MNILSAIQLGTLASIAGTVGNGNPPSISFEEGKDPIEPGKKARYRIKTNAVNPKIKWTISLPDLKLIEIHGKTEIEVTPAKEGTLNLTVTVTAGNGKSSERVWSVVVKKK